MPIRKSIGWQAYMCGCPYKLTDLHSDVRIDQPTFNQRAIQYAGNCVDHWCGELPIDKRTGHFTIVFFLLLATFQILRYVPKKYSSFQKDFYFLSTQSSGIRTKRIYSFKKDFFFQKDFSYYQQNLASGGLKIFSRTKETIQTKGYTKYFVSPFIIKMSDQTVRTENPFSFITEIHWKLC